MVQFLSLRCDLEWLKRSAKDRLRELRLVDPTSKLSQAQHIVAREFGFKSWPELNTHVEQVRGALRDAFPILAKPLSALHSGPNPSPEVVDRFADLIRRGQVGEAKMMLEEHPRLAITPTADGHYPIHLAGRFNDVRAGILLLAFGADPEAIIHGTRHNALSWAVTCNAQEFARAMIKLGAASDLFISAGIGDMDLVTSCLDEYQDAPNVLSHTGSTRLADDMGAHGLHSESLSDDVSDALYIAARNGQAEVVRHLIAHGARLDYKGFAGATALHWAYFSGNPAVVETLLGAGSDSQGVDDTFGCQPFAFGLTACAAWGLGFKIDSLANLSPRAISSEGQRTTPLHEAAASGNGDIVKRLLELGADRNQRDHQNRMPEDRAESSGHTAIVSLLRSQ
ncbi:MAG: ankyrin repeat domain-containing protein [Pirellulales bacterium]